MTNEVYQTLYELYMMLYDINFLSAFVRLFLAMLLGGILGYGREKKHLPAGFRTYMVVCLGSALAMMVGIYVTDVTGAADASRIGAQVVSGISFLGAGTILVTRQNQVKGLTTAAGLWAVACLGLALGAGFYSGALICFAALWISIQILRFVDKRLQTHSKTIAIYIEFTKIADLSAFMTFAGANNCTISNLEMTRSNPTDRDASVSATMILHFEAATEYAQVVEIYGALDGIIMMKAL
jgi:putative Mg2+ transporter-C (MgtC) family protein